MIDRQSERGRVWVVVVDGSVEPHPAWRWADHYIHCPDIPLGASRNMAIEAGLAVGAEYLALWDDDDYYAPEHLERMIAALEAAPPTTGVAGASLTPLYYLNDGAVLVAGPYCEGHALEPTLVFRADYLRNPTHRFLPLSKGLSAEILENYAAPLVQVWGTMVVICHDSNTYDKGQIRERPAAYRAREVWGSDVPDVVWGLLEWMSRGKGYASGHPMMLDAHQLSSFYDIRDTELPSSTYHWIRH